MNNYANFYCFFSSKIFPFVKYTIIYFSILVMTIVNIWYLNNRKNFQNYFGGKVIINRLIIIQYYQ